MSSPHRREARVRLVVGTILPTALAILVVVPAVALRSRLPEAMATHWALSGSANGSMPVLAFVRGTLLFSLVPAVIAMRVSRRRPAVPGEIASALAASTFVLAVTALLAPMVAANLDAAVGAKPA